MLVIAKAVCCGKLSAEMEIIARCGSFEYFGSFSIENIYRGLRIRCGYCQCKSSELILIIVGSMRIYFFLTKKITPKRLRKIDFWATS
jgi:hypothetical protein